MEVPQIVTDVYSNGRFLGGTLGGSSAQRLLSCNMDPGVLRPYIGPDNRHYVDLRDGWVEDPKTHMVRPKYKPVVYNGPATLRYDEWKLIDRAIQKPTRKRLRVWRDLNALGLSRNIPNGMSVMAIQSQTRGNAGTAGISMNALRETNRFRMEYGTIGHPLPITHAEFSYDLRELLVSRNIGPGLDTDAIEQCRFNMDELTEQMALGLLSSYTWFGYTVYGMLNHPSRVAYGMTAPTTLGWNPEDTYFEILAALQALRDNRIYGPFGCYYSPAWAQYMARPYSASTPTAQSLRLTLQNNVNEVQFWEQSDYLSGFRMVIFVLDDDQVQAITGMNTIPVQWEEQGGLAFHWKLLKIEVIRVRPNGDGNLGVLDMLAT
jgi:hypothetical protein